MSRFVFIAALVCATPAFADTTYFAAIDDVPLPSRFVERDAGASFDSGAGRVVMASAEGDLTGLQVRDFYNDVLPQLGWSIAPQADSALVFQRGRERLSFTLERVGAHTRLNAQLVVHPASMTAD